MKEVGTALLFILGVMMSALLLAHMADYSSLMDRVETLEQQFGDPHHCVSECVEQFEKMGC